MKEVKQWQYSLLVITFPSWTLPFLMPGMQGTFQSETDLLLLLCHKEPNKEHRLDRFTRNFITVRTGSFVPAKGKEKQLLKNVWFILIKFRSITCRVVDLSPPPLGNEKGNLVQYRPYGYLKKHHKTSVIKPTEFFFPLNNYCRLHLSG